MVEKVQEVADKKSVLPQDLRMRAVGQREGMDVDARINILEEDEISRNAIFRLGRLVVDGEYTVIADGKTVARMYNDGKNWQIITTVDGKEVTETKSVGNTKKPGKNAGGKIDNGPSLLSAATVAFNALWPSLKQTAGRAGTSATAKIATQNLVIADLVAKLAELMGVSVEEAAKAAGIELPKTKAQGNGDAEDVAEEVNAA